MGLLTLALEFATAEAARSSSLNKAIAALPMVLLEDLLESQVKGGRGGGGGKGDQIPRFVRLECVV